MVKRIAFAWRGLVGAVLLSLLVFSHIYFRNSYQVPYPHFNELIMEKEDTGLTDIALLVSGFRSVAADVAWVQLLQYTGGSEILDVSKADHDFPRLKSMTLRVVRIDPFFLRAYEFGAVILAWIKSVNRPGEAIEVLEEGIRYNPTHWPFHSYLIGIGYQKINQIGKMLSALGETIRRPDCPPLVKAILANTFKLNREYEKAIEIWIDIYSSSDDTVYQNRAVQQISELKKLRSSLH